MPNPPYVVIAATLLGLTACGDTPSVPEAVDPDLATVAAQSSGQPVVTREVIDDFFVIPAGAFCTFPLQIDADGQRITQEWFDDSGQIRRARAHENIDASFTNLATGLSATNNSNQNIESHWDANGNLTRLVFNGSPQKIHEYEGTNNTLRFYQIGHRVITFDPSTGDITSAVFHGRTNEETQAGPCDALS